MPPGAAGVDDVVVVEAADDELGAGAAVLEAGAGAADDVGAVVGDTCGPGTELPADDEGGGAELDAGAGGPPGLCSGFLPCTAIII